MQLLGYSTTRTDRQGSLQHNPSVHSHYRTVDMHVNPGPDIFGSAPYPCAQKTFFDARQKEGQSATEFREELLSLLEEADGANITCNDLICMMLQIGLSNSNLQRELGAIRNPTLDAFNDKIEGFEQAETASP